MSASLETTAPEQQNTDLVKKLITILSQPDNDDQKVTQYLSAQQLSEIINIELGDEGCSESDLIIALQRYLRLTPKTWRPEFAKLLFSGRDNAGLLADWVTSFNNTTMHTYQVAPVASLMEMEIIHQLNRLIGFDSADTQADGLMVSGGSMANMVAMMMARHQVCPDIKEQGFSGKPLVAYVSELAHYSFEKAANILGIGSNNLIPVKSDDEGRLLPSDLEQQISRSLKQNKQPFFIGLTAGTTVIGSFDPIAPCSEIAQRYGLWLHIDGAWGAPVLFSQQHSPLLKDCQLADSFTWDAHKLMNIPLTASLILVKEGNKLLDACSGGGEAYLFHADENAEFNLGLKSLQCGRRVDSLKLWASWKVMGATGYGEKIDRLMSLKNDLVEKINKQKEFCLLAPAPFLNVLFRFEPPEIRDEKQLAQLNIAICKALLKDGLYFVDYAHYKDRLGIRFILANDRMNAQTIDQFLDHCQRLGHKLSNNIWANNPLP